ncbi:uncharacterized protein [Rutidosis leptorrhynchoides]|uniref:uncharacterized protein n=1 Tax=Rutidosis leptorrhynchoides TaxID=125765 RepID=UPI003A9A600D
MVATNWDWSRDPYGRATRELYDLGELLNSSFLNPDKLDTWGWDSISNRIYTTKGLTKLINEKTIGMGTNAKGTMKNNLVPKKVEVFIWRAMKKCLPVRTELDKRRIDLHSVRCPFCDDDLESVDHSLLSCTKAVEVWNKVYGWWGLGRLPNMSLEYLLQGDVRQKCLDSGKLIWQAVIWVSTYLMWRNRNHAVFKNKCWSTPVALSEIQIKSYEWIAKRNKGMVIDWHNRFHSPSCFLV